MLPANARQPQFFDHFIGVTVPTIRWVITLNPKFVEGLRRGSTYSAARLTALESIRKPQISRDIFRG